MPSCGVCLSVRSSVTFVDHVKTNKHIVEIFSPSGFSIPKGVPIFRREPPNGGVECRWGIGRNRDSGLTAGYRRLLDVRSTKWQKQLPTTMQCRSHSRRRTIECLFVTACSMDQYAEEKRTEKNLIVRSDISEAETTNNKRLRSTFCIEAIVLKHRAASLRQQRFLCIPEP